MLFLSLIGTTFLNTNASNLEANNKSTSIKLKFDRPTTRSGSPTINAFADGQSISVEVSNYSGIVQVEVMGAGGAQSQTMQISGGGVCMLDISALQSGSYSLRIILGNQIYEGEFQK